MSTTTTLVESASSLADRAVEGTLPDSTNTQARWLGYLARIKPLLITSSRYLAYTSDIGEAFRPVVNPSFVQAAYLTSWLYVGTDCAYEGYRTHLRYHERQLAGKALPNEPSESTEVSIKVVKRALFQGTASMLFPALTIHTAVKWTGKACHNLKSQRMRGVIPTVVGLGIVPFLPYIFDEPIEHIVDKGFAVVERKFGLPPNEEPVRHVPIEMREKKEL